MTVAIAILLRLVLSMVALPVAWCFQPFLPDHQVFFWSTKQKIHPLHSQTSTVLGAKKSSRKSKRSQKSTTTGFGSSKVATAPRKSQVTISTPHAISSVPKVHLRLADYAQPAFWVTHAYLDVNIPNNLQQEPVAITSQLTIETNADSPLDNEWLVLDGDCEVLSLHSISWIMDSATEATKVDLIPESDYYLDPQKHQLRVCMNAEVLRHFASSTSLDDGGPQEFPKLEMVVRIGPLEKTELSGLFHRPRSRNNNNPQNIPPVILTHCEPIGFRQITFFPDRPDNTAIFTVRIEASQQDYPLLLSNGELIDSGIMKNMNDNESQQRHFVVYHDPHPKPSYIFALLASPAWCAHLQDTYQTSISGKSIDIHIYCPDYPSTKDKSPALEKLQFALQTIKKAMAFDEERFGLEYDGNTYTIVAMQQFALGAMENKGLNFFQTSLIATSLATTTDITYDLVEKTIAHEYFHNWSGNRVSVRDWFQFGLKEGLTVFRDQEFCAEMGLKSIARIEAVKILKEKQFAEDASEERRPVLPEDMQVQMSTSAYLDSLASSTSYHKGAEIVRMIQTILGQEIFQEGLSLYFEKYKDGHGATCHDFLSAIQDAAAKNNHDFANHIQQFSLWYTQAGTPLVTCDYSYDADMETVSLTFRQSLAHAEDDQHDAMYIPITVGLLADESGGEEVLPSTVLHLKEKEQTFRFDSKKTSVIPSILRGFSAPVILQLNEEEPGDATELQSIAFLAGNDTDGYNRWQAMQQLYTTCIMDLLLMNDAKAARTKESMKLLLTAFRRTLQNQSIDHATKSYLLKIPSESTLLREVQNVNSQDLHRARQKIGSLIFSESKDALRELYDELTSSLPSKSEVSTDTKARAERALRNSLLEVICFSTDESDIIEAADIASTHLDNSQCFSDKLTAFQCLSSMEHPSRTEAIQKFHKYAIETNDSMVLNKWFQVQALSDHKDVLSNVQQLTQHPHFKATNVGQFRSLLVSFTMNANAFHTEEGYRFIGSVINQMDRVAPSLAVELLVRGFSKWRQHSSGTLMKKELERMSSSKISPSLANAMNQILRR